MSRNETSPLTETRVCVCCARNLDALVDGFMAQFNRARVARGEAPVERTGAPATGDESAADAPEPPREEYDVVLPVDVTSAEFREAEALMRSMGFRAARTRKALLLARGSLEDAIEWLGEHQDDADIDAPELSFQQLRSIGCVDLLCSTVHHPMQAYTHLQVLYCC